METIVSISEVQRILADLGLESEFVDARTEVPLLNIGDYDLGLPDPNSAEFDNFTLGSVPDSDNDLYIKGDLFFILRYVYSDIFTQIGWDVQDLTSGNGICPLFNIEKVYPFEEDIRYVVTCPNSINDDIENEECNTFEVIVAPKGEEDADFDWSNTKAFKTIHEVIEFIYGEE